MHIARRQKLILNPHSFPVLNVCLHAENWKLSQRKRIHSIAHMFYNGRAISGRMNRECEQESVETKKK